MFVRAGELHLQKLGAQAAANHRALARAQHGFVDIKLIRIDGALNHRLTQAIAGGNKNHVRKARFGIDGEHHARGAQVRAHHALNARTERHVLVGKAFVHPVADGAVVVQRSKYLADFVQHIVDADHVQKGFLLAGKRCIRQVFGRSRRTHCIGRRRIACAQCGERVANGLLQIGRERLNLHHRADFSASHRQGAHIFDIQCTQARVDSAAQVAMRQKSTKRMGGGGKSGGHLHALGQLRNHFAQAGVLAPHRLHVAHAQALKRDDPIGIAK